MVRILTLSFIFRAAAHSSWSPLQSQFLTLTFVAESNTFAFGHLRIECSMYFLEVSLNSPAGTQVRAWPCRPGGLILWLRNSLQTFADKTAPANISAESFSAIHI